MKETIHVVPHAHWDREWYMPFEWHRARLADHLDRVLDLLEGEDYPTYHLDGQMIAVEDYLAVRPEKRALLEKQARAGRLKLGPWYVLQDEYLTSGEANVRNLLRGLRMAEAYGGACRIGYLPDAFGNVSQMPQLLRQAGMTAAAFGRGVEPAGTDGAADPARCRPARSEFFWESPDGSRVLSLFFANWYNNGQEIPVSPQEARAYWDRRLAQARRYASADQLLFLNGSDHQPVQRDLPQALETARRLYPELEFVQSDLERFAQRVLESGAALETVSGELAGQETAGNNTLCNTASSRMPLKALNRENEVLLERFAEPLSAMAAMAGGGTDPALLERAWMLLMQNHPHDSICGCSIDEVHRETEGRYARSIQLGRLLTEQAGRQLSGRIAAPGLGEAAAAFAVWNTSGWPGTQTAEAVVSLERVYGTREARRALLAHPAGICRLTDSRDRELPCTVEDLGVCFGYELPEDSFRRPYFERRVRVRFQAEDIPAFGYQVFYLREGAPAPAGPDLAAGPRRMENRFVRVEIGEDGTFSLTEKGTGRVYRNLGYYEDAGDVGDEYIFRETLGEPVTTLGRPADIVCLENTPFRACFRITHKLEIPACADGALAEAAASMEPRMERRIGRGGETVLLELRTFLTLEEGSPLVRFRTEWENTARDHRLRALFPTGLDTDWHLADSVFDVIPRPDVPGAAWTNPSRCQRMQYFVAAEDGEGGLLCANRGAYEYEVLPRDKTLAVTLLRAVGELGDWGVFPTPEAQCLGPASMELGIAAYSGGLRRDGCRLASQFQADPPAFQIFQAEGSLPERGSFLRCRGEGLAFTAFKRSEDGKGYILRLFNTGDAPSELALEAKDGYAYYRSNILEEPCVLLEPDAGGTLRLPVGGREILTIRFENI